MSNTNRYSKVTITAMHTGMTNGNPGLFAPFLGMTILSPSGYFQALWNTDE